MVFVHNNRFEIRVVTFQDRLIGAIDADWEGGGVSLVTSGESNRSMDAKRWGWGWGTILN